MDYSQINFKCGIEIHQQIEGKKLFCNCPTTIKDTKPDFEFKRRLRVSAGESGKVDIAAKAEQAKGKEFVYQGYHDVNCLVELDEEPPHEVNTQALETAMKVALLLHAKPVDEIQFMRKIVVDGSNTSGFQRTALIATDGYIETSEGKIRIPTICLEEESAKVIERTPTRDTYNISRLGIPLIEIATEPDIKSPEGAKEASAKLGMILRSVQGIKRGLGSIRQDVNVSVKNTNRVEIKGFQEIDSMPKVIEKEIERRLKIIESKKEPEHEVRKAEADGSTTFLRPMPGADRMYPETDVPSFRIDTKHLPLPELISDKAGKIAKLGLSKELSDDLAKTGKADLLISFVEEFTNLKASSIAEIMLSMPKIMRRKYAIDIKPSDDDYKTLFTAMNQGKISKDSLEDIFKEQKPMKDVLGKYQLMSDADVEKEIKKIVSENKELPFNALIGKVMGALRGKADSKKVVEMLNALK
ncbi:MAG TPA: Glu-tRNA(Gln) amidotransferase subunit GatE [Candidatus Nanoarchaeia archaeon]|nr:Glu-tRNA(Gln) amidotransferase subunit GatE [Candidatus Nanoarchaeia archaeon]